MLDLVGLLFLAALVGYGAVTAAYVASLSLSSPRLSRLGFWLTIAWGLVAAGAIMGLARPTTRIANAFLAPVAFGLILCGLLQQDTPRTTALLPDAMASSWVVVHMLASYASLCLFALAFGAGVVYLLQDFRLKQKKISGADGLRLPPLEVLDQVVQSGFAGGVGFLTMGILFGTFWAVSEGAEGLGLRPKVVATAALWLLYAVGWQARSLLGWGGRRTAWIAIVGFVGVVASVVGVAHG